MFYILFVFHLLQVGYIYPQNLISTAVYLTFFINITYSNISGTIIFFSQTFCVLSLADAAEVLRQNRRLFEQNVAKSMRGGYVGSVYFERCLAK